MRNIGLEYENLDQKVHSVIRDMIMDRKLLPGEKIPQEKLAKELGVSRTPIVSALKYLEQEKLVESKPRRGFYVRLFSDTEMVYIFEVREVLEGLAARRAAIHAGDAKIEKLKPFFKRFAGPPEIKDVKGYAREDRKFHNYIIEIGAEDILKGILKTYNILSYSYQRLASEGLIRPPEDTVFEHLAIIDAIVKRDAEKAESLTRMHFEKSTALLKRMMTCDEESDFLTG